MNNEASLRRGAFMFIDAVMSLRINHPLRFDFVNHVYFNGPTSPIAYAKVTGQQITNVSYHVRLLAEADTLILVDEVPVRGAVEHIYDLRTMSREVLDGLVRAAMLAREDDNSPEVRRARALEPIREPVPTA